MELLSFSNEGKIMKPVSPCKFLQILLTLLGMQAFTGVVLGCHGIFFAEFIEYYARPIIFSNCLLGPKPDMYSDSIWKD